MKKLLVLATLVVAALSACKKQNTTAAFSVAKASFYLNEPVAFNSQSENPKNFSWDFGDGQTSDQENPVHKFGKAGNYTIKLTTGNSSITKNIKIWDGTASFIIHNQMSFGFPPFFFWTDANGDIDDLLQVAPLAAGAKSDTIPTSQSSVYVGGLLNGKLFFVAQPYAINKFTHQTLVVSNSSSFYVQQSTGAGIKSLAKQLTGRTNLEAAVAKP